MRHQLAPVLLPTRGGPDPAEAVLSEFQRLQPFGPLVCLFEVAIEELAR